MATMETQDLEVSLVRMVAVDRLENLENLGNKANPRMVLKENVAPEVQMDAKVQMVSFN